MKIAILDDYQDCVRSLQCFQTLGEFEVTVFNETVKDETKLSNMLQPFDAIVLIRQRTTISASLLATLPRLRVIAQTGKAGSHIDLAACTQANVTVLDAEGSGEATAELNMLLILAALRNFNTEVQRLKSGLWQGTLGRRLYGRTLGIYGYGKIGQQLCKMGAAFGAKLLVWGRENSQTQARADGIEVALSRDDFFERCDVLSLQLRLNPQTRHIITARDLSLMKPTALLVNASRAELIEPGALEAALKAGRPGFAAVDVYEDEPVLNADHPLIHLPNCLCSPHLGFVELDNFEAYFSAAFNQLVAFFKNLANQS